MKLTATQRTLLCLIIEEHGEQVRKYSGEPYWEHPYAVAKMVAHIPLGIEVGLCHDLIEDTGITGQVLVEALRAIGYSDEEADTIFYAVMELTDVYVKEDYPDLNRAARKEMEAERLGGISALAQSVKYADIIHNVDSICKHDEKFAKTYTKEKMQSLSKMTAGDSELRSRAMLIVKTGIRLPDPKRDM